LNTDKFDALNHLMDRFRSGDFEGFLDCMTDDIEYHYHMASPPLRGKDKMRKFLANYSSGYEQRKWEVYNWAANDKMLLVEGYEELYDHKYSRVIRNPFMQAVEFRDGKICKLRDHYEASSVRPPAAVSA
jgi:ketosteroid isomerase-like protein